MDAKDRCNRLYSMRNNIMGKIYKKEIWINDLRYECSYILYSFADKVVVHVYSILSDYLFLWG